MRSSSVTLAPGACGAAASRPPAHQRVVIDDIQGHGFQGVPSRQLNGITPNAGPCSLGAGSLPVNPDVSSRRAARDHRGPPPAGSPDSASAAAFQPHALARLPRGTQGRRSAATAALAIQRKNFPSVSRYCLKPGGAAGNLSARGAGGHVPTRERRPRRPAARPSAAANAHALRRARLQDGLHLGRVGDGAGSARAWRDLGVDAARTRAAWHRPSQCRLRRLRRNSAVSPGWRRPGRSGTGPSLGLLRLAGRARIGHDAGDRDFQRICSRGANRRNRVVVALLILRPSSPGSSATASSTCAASAQRSPTGG